MDRKKQMKPIVNIGHVSIFIHVAMVSSIARTELMNLTVILHHLLTVQLIVTYASHCRHIITNVSRQIKLMMVTLTVLVPWMNQTYVELQMENHLSADYFADSPYPKVVKDAQSYAII
jgi:hypothetical protein